MRKMSAKIVEVRQHITLLDKPIWTPSRTLSKLDYYTDDNGFEIRTDCGLPTMFDRLILGDLMKESQRRGNAKILEFDSMNALVKTLKFTSSGKALKMVQDSLKRWESVSLSLTPPIKYDHGRKTASAFGIMRYAIITKNGGVRIKFTDKLIELNQDSYTRRLKMELLKHIGRDISPFALRLYEVVSIFTHKGRPFTIGLENLFKKLAVPYYPRRHSEALEQIKSAVEKLTEADDELKNLECLYGEENRDVEFRNNVDYEKDSQDKELQQAMHAVTKMYKNIK